MINYERLYPGDEVVYKNKYYWVSNACYIANDDMQVVKLIRMADIESNRTIRPSIKVRANECKIIYESLSQSIVNIRHLRRYK